MFRCYASASASASAQNAKRRHPRSHGLQTVSRLVSCNLVTSSCQGSAQPSGPCTSHSALAIIESTAEKTGVELANCSCSSSILPSGDTGQDTIDGLGHFVTNAAARNVADKPEALVVDEVQRACLSYGGHLAKAKRWCHIFSLLQVVDAMRRRDSLWRSLPTCRQSQCAVADVMYYSRLRWPLSRYTDRAATTSNCSHLHGSHYYPQTWSLAQARWRVPSIFDSSMASQQHEAGRYTRMRDAVRSASALSTVAVL